MLQMPKCIETAFKYTCMSLSCLLKNLATFNCNCQSMGLPVHVNIILSLWKLARKVLILIHVFLEQPNCYHCMDSNLVSVSLERFYFLASLYAWFFHQGFLTCIFPILLSSFFLGGGKGVINLPYSSLLKQHVERHFMKFKNQQNNYWQSMHKWAVLIHWEEVLTKFATLSFSVI